MNEYPIYPRWRRILGGLIFIALGGFAIRQALYGTRDPSNPVPTWVVSCVVVLGVVFVATGLGIIFSKRFRPPGAP